MAEWKEPYVAVETVNITATGKTVSLPRRYHPGQGDLVVYVNGMYAIPGKDYKETTAFAIDFTENVEPGDVVVAHYQKLW